MNHIKTMLCGHFIGIDKLERLKLLQNDPLVNEFDKRAWRLLTPVRASRCGSPIRRNHLTPGGAKRQCSIRKGEHMTISAQVMILSSSGLMTTCINRCVLMISLAMPGIRNGICNGCFYSIKGRAWGAIFAKSCCWPPAICVTPISGSTISA